MPTTEPVFAQAIETTLAALVIVAKERRVRIPWERCSPRLARASAQELRHAELSPNGYGIHWPLIDDDLSVDNLLQLENH